MSDSFNYTLNMFNLGEKHHYRKNTQYIKDRIECFDDYFLRRKKKCKVNQMQ